MGKTILFVYGTLKRGLRNHRLIADQEFLGEAVTAPRYRVIDLGLHPGLVTDESNGLAVKGELWAVSDCCLAELDDFEEVPGLFFAGGSIADGREAGVLESTGAATCLAAGVALKSRTSFMEYRPRGRFAKELAARRAAGVAVATVTRVRPTRALSPSVVKDDRVAATLSLPRTAYSISLLSAHRLILRYHGQNGPCTSRMISAKWTRVPLGESFL